MKIKWLGKLKEIRLLLIIFYTLLFLLFFIEFFVHKHAELFFEGLLFFFPIYGFFSCILVFGAAKILIKIVKRDPDYYEQ